VSMCVAFRIHWISLCTPLLQPQCHPCVCAGRSRWASPLLRAPKRPAPRLPRPPRRPLDLHLPRPPGHAPAMFFKSPSSTCSLTVKTFV
jgi:hypothetical protein